MKLRTPERDFSTTDVGRNSGRKIASSGSFLNGDSDCRLSDPNTHGTYSTGDSHGSSSDGGTSRRGATLDRLAVWRMQVGK